MKSGFLFAVKWNVLSAKLGNNIRTSCALDLTHLQRSIEFVGCFNRQKQFLNLFEILISPKVPFSMHNFTTPNSLSGNTIIFTVRTHFLPLNDVFLVWPNWQPLFFLFLFLLNEPWLGPGSESILTLYYFRLVLNETRLELTTLRSLSTRPDHSVLWYPHFCEKIEKFQVSFFSFLQLKLFYIVQVYVW